MTSRDQVRQLGGWLASGGALGLLAVLANWAEAHANGQTAWPLWLYWLFGCMTVAGLITRHAARPRQEGWTSPATSPPSAAPAGLTEAGVAVPTWKQPQQPEPLRFVPSVTIRADRDIEIGLTNAGPDGQFYAEGSTVNDLAGLTPVRAVIGLEHTRAPWPIPWTDDPSGKPRHMSRGDSAAVVLERVGPVRTDPRIMTIARFHSTGDDASFILEGLEGKVFRVSMVAETGQRWEQRFHVGINPTDMTPTVQAVSH